MILSNIFFNLLQSTGGFIAVARLASATPVPPSVLSRGIGWQVNITCELKLFFSSYLNQWN